jgi:ribosomal protein L16/L10AE
MGKGKGKLSNWVCNIRYGTILLEIKNTRFGRAIFFLKQLKYKLTSKARIITYFASNHMSTKTCKQKLIFPKRKIITNEYIW